MDLVFKYDTILISEACFRRLIRSDLWVNEHFRVIPVEFCIHDHFKGTYYWDFGKHPSDFGLSGTLDENIKEVHCGQVGNQVPWLNFVNWVRRYREVNGASFCQCTLINCCTVLYSRD